MSEGRKRVVAVSDELTPVRQLLEERGFEVIPISDETYPRADAVIITGMTRDLMGMQDRRAEVPIIDATGRDAHEVLQVLQERLAWS